MRGGADKKTPQQKFDELWVEHQILRSDFEHERSGIKYVNAKLDHLKAGNDEAKFRIEMLEKVFIRQQARLLAMAGKSKKVAMKKPAMKKSVKTVARAVSVEKVAMRS